MRSKELNRLAKLLAYVIGRHPDEFGLVTDSSGFVELKDLLKALHEESDWRHVRNNHMKELSISHAKPTIEIVDTKIRAIDRTQLPHPSDPTDCPKLLYICVRTKAYPVVADKGISPRKGPWVILSSSQKMALRLGQRFTTSPVLLTVNTKLALQANIKILAFGKKLFLAPYIPAKCFSGPSLPKEKKSVKEKKQSPQPISPPTPGSYYLNLNQGNNDPIAKNNNKGKKQKGWKEARRKDRRHKPKNWP